MEHVDVLANATTLWNYLRINQELFPADLILILGGHDPGVGPHAASLFKKHLSQLIVVSGGSAHVPPSVDGKAATTEADAIASYLEKDGIPSHSVILERRAANTSENFWFTADLLESKKIHINSCILVTKPYQERRALATGMKRWPNVDLAVSGAPMGLDTYLQGSIPEKKIINMLVGEVHRIEKYSAEGFLFPQEVPQNVREACEALLRAGYSERSLE